MSTKTVIATLDRLLEPLGFSRQKTTWNREIVSITDVIDVQVSKAGDAFTINAGVFDKAVYATLWGNEPPPVIQPPECTVGVRIGELLGDKDKWWQFDDEQAVADVVRSIESHLLPFLERMHARQAMKQWLVEAGVVRKKYPMPIISLAILQSLLGDRTEARNLLAELQRKSVGAWRARAAVVAERIGCA